jgi:hypothetical protein
MVGLAEAEDGLVAVLAGHQVERIEGRLLKVMGPERRCWPVGVVVICRGGSSSERTYIDTLHHCRLSFFIFVFVAIDVLFAAFLKHDRVVENAVLDHLALRPDLEYVQAVVLASQERRSKHCGRRSWH